MSHIFLSHSPADAAGAKPVARLLRNAGLPVWLDLDQITPGELWQPALEAALEGSTHFVVLAGETGVQQWVDREVRYAVDRNTKDPSYRVIPLLGPGAREGALPPFLQQHQYLRLDWREPDAAAIQKVAATILQAPAERIGVLPPDTSPFRGLLTFEAEDALLFFGRDREVDELLERLSKTRFLPIVGDSGSGKSSLVRAGLIPALLRGRMGTIDWRIATMKPGQYPLDALAEAVPQFDPGLDAADRLRMISEVKAALHREGNVDGLSESLAALQLPANSRQLLVIDQFEQLFTLALPGDAAARNAERFVTTLLRGAQRANSTLQVAATLRVDFFGLCHRYPELWQVLSQHHYSVGRMEPDRLREVIEKPMAIAGVPLEPGLADIMIGDAGTQPGALALLEHALDQLWRECKGQSSTLTHYRNIGRLKGAIRAHADRVLSGRLASEARREMARRIFVELTALGEGAEDSARRVPKAQILSLPGEEADQVLQILTDERLVTTGDTDDPDAVTIAHEALIREWDALRGWVDKRREDIRFERELKHAEEAWREGGQDRDQLLRGGRLEAAIHWRQRNAGELRTEVVEFVEASWRRRNIWRAVRWGSFLTAMSILFVLALPAMKAGLLRVRAFRATVRVNQNDGLKYLYIRPGEFQMGCSTGCSGNDQQHRVRIPKEFWIGQTEVTQAAYKRVMKGEDPSQFKGDNRPVENVSWNQAEAYCRAIDMRLPTEAEWEYAARAGNSGELYGELGKIAVYASTSTAAVASKLPNAWGLYDTLGNVWEWTNDWYDKNYYQNSAMDDPPGPSAGKLRIVRGGSWDASPRTVRVSFRVGDEPTIRNSLIGFRCAGELH